VGRGVLRDLKKLIGLEEYLKMQYKKAQLVDRKADARKKIQLGGLFCKADLDDMHPHDAPILYGMLLDCKAALQERPDLRKRWSHLGRELLVGVK